MGYVKNSLFLAVVGTLITLVISSMCGYALAIYRFEIDVYKRQAHSRAKPAHRPCGTICAAR